MLSSDPAHAFMPYPARAVSNAETGSLVGLTFAVKDLFDVAGYPTSNGHPIALARSGTKQRTAPCIQALLDAGARFIGKTVTDELAYSLNGRNAHFGTPRNAAAPDRIPGGSSSGSAAAVAHRLCEFAIGTDTAGSVRAPANHCGIFGMRTTHGRVSLENAMPLAPSFDTLGFFASDAKILTRAGAIILGNDPEPTLIARSPRLLRPLELWDLLSREVVDAFVSALARIQSLHGLAQPISVAIDGLDAMRLHFRYVQGFETWKTHGDFIARYAPPFGPGIGERFAWAKTVTTAQWSAGKSFCDRFRGHLADVLGADGVLVLPTMPDIAPLLAVDEADLERYRNESLQLLCLAGLSGFPQVSLPLASRLGAPLGISLLGPAGSDRALIELATHIALRT